VIELIELNVTEEIISRHTEFLFGEENVNKSGRINKKLEAAYRGERSKLGKDVFKFVIDHFKEIVLSDLETLFEIKEEYTEALNRISTESTKKRVHNKLKKMFHAEYKYFYSDPVFNAYQLQSLLDINICPLCATQFIFLYESQSGSTRGTLDHFIDKGKYPIFAVSIYNLIPACKVCNSDFKRTLTVDLENHYTPYEKGVIDYIKFRKMLIQNEDEKIVPNIIEQLKIEEATEIDYVSALLGINDDFNIRVDYSSAPPNIFKKIDGNIKLFKVEELYNIYHRKFVREQIRKAYVYNYIYRKQLMYNFSNLFVTEEEVRALIVPNVEDDNKYILNKLIRDIVLVETERFSI